jgi:hypothetical protein
MPWKRAKALPPPDNTLFEACFRIQREACDAAGRLIPMVVENVCGAQKWVGDARWHHGSFYLWGDVPALMPNLQRGCHALVGAGSSGVGFTSDMLSSVTVQPSRNGRLTLTSLAVQEEIKQPGLVGRRGNGKGSRWFQDGAARHGSKSHARKMASAHIAKIPLPLSRHIAAAWKPEVSL